MTQFGRVGLAASHAHINKRLEKRSCSQADLLAGALYTYPNASSVVDGTKTVTFTWDTTCPVGTSTIDLYLYDPSASNALIHAWTGVTFSSGSYPATLQPKWWNDTTSAQLQLNIIAGGGESFLTSWPSGPVFNVTYSASAMYQTTTENGVVQTSTAAAAATQSKDAVFQSVSSTGGHGISKGAIAAAVVVPLLVLSAVIGLFVYFYRMKEQEKRKRWSHALSSHSNLEWEKGALPGEKPSSIAGRPSTNFGGRPSTSYGRPSISSMRPPSSILAAENMAGAGAGGGPQRPPFAQLRSNSAGDLHALRSSVVLADGQVRQSRISFAETQRPDRFTADRRSRMSFAAGESRPSLTLSGIWKQPSASKSATELGNGHTAAQTRRSTAYATGSAIDDEDDDGINISPSQVQGPAAFADAEMRRAGQGRRTGRRSMLSIGGGDKARRNSTASALSVDDFRSAASARGSVDELRDLEAVMLMRRSFLSQTNSRSPQLGPTEMNSPNAYHLPHPDNTDYVESLDNENSSPSVPSIPGMPMPSTSTAVSSASSFAPSGSASKSTTTVAYGPDQMLAVYAARGKVSPAATPTSAVPPTSTVPVPPLKSAASGMRRLLGRKDTTGASSTSEESVSMRSLVHLNNGTAPSSAIDALPLPGPPQQQQQQQEEQQQQQSVTSPTVAQEALRIPSFAPTRRIDVGQSYSSNVASAGSMYLDDEDDEHVGEAK